MINDLFSPKPERTSGKELLETFYPHLTDQTLQDNFFMLEVDIETSQEPIKTHRNTGFKALGKHSESAKCLFSIEELNFRN